MNSQEARFVQIKRLSEDEVGELHRVEQGAGVNWMIIGAQKLVDINRIKPPFWDQRKSEEDKMRQIDIFLHSAAVKAAFLILQDQIQTEIEVMHEADWRVWRYAPAIGAGVGDEMREKSKPKFT